MWKIIATTAITAALVGCATGGGVPADKLSRASSAVRSAQEMGADRDVRAAKHLALASSQLAMGRKLVIDGESDEARLVLMRAEADAIPAMDLAREMSARAQAEK